MRFTSPSLAMSALLVIATFPAFSRAEAPATTDTSTKQSAAKPSPLLQALLQQPVPQDLVTPAAQPPRSPVVTTAVAPAVKSTPITSVPSLLKAEEAPSATPAWLAAWDDKPLLPPTIQAPDPQSEAPLGDINTVGPPQWRAETDAMLSGPIPIDLNRPAQLPGWVGSVDVSIVQPYIGSKISSGALLDGTFPGNPVTLPIGAMNFIGAPRVELGYRWPDGLGELRTSFQLINSSGNRMIPDLAPGATRALASRLQMNVFDLDYCFSEFNLGDIPVISPIVQIPGWLGLRRPPTIYQNDPLVMRMRFGARAASMFFDAQATGVQILNERMMSNFAGAGLHVAVEATKAMPWRPLSMYGKLDFGGILGPVRQRFLRTDALGNSAEANVHTSDGAPTFGLEWGLQFVPANFSNFRGALAYQYGQWWQFADTRDSTAIFQTNGVVLSGQWGF